MTFNDTTNKSGAIQECEAWLFGGNYGAISVNPTLLSRFTALINSGLNDTEIEIFKSDGKWQYDDSNNTDTPEGYTDLADGIRNYTLDISHLKINGVEVKDINGDYIPLTQIDYRDIRQSGQSDVEFMESSGKPQYYDIVGDQLKLFPAPSSSAVNTSAEGNGLRVIYQRYPSYFSSSDTTKAFGIPKIFDTFPVLFACSTYAKQNSMTDKARELDAEIATKRKDIKSFMNSRNVDKRKSIRPAYRSAM